MYLQTFNQWCILALIQTETGSLQCKMQPTALWAGPSIDTISINSSQKGMTKTKTGYQLTPPIKCSFSCWNVTRWRPSICLSSDSVRSSSSLSYSMTLAVPVPVSSSSSSSSSSSPAKRLCSSEVWYVGPPPSGGTGYSSGGDGTLEQIKIRLKESNWLLDPGL